MDDALRESHVPVEEAEREAYPSLDELHRELRRPTPRRQRGDE